MNFKTTQQQFGIAEPVKPFAETNVHPYTAYLLNASDWVVVGLYQNDSYRPLQPFGRTCSGDIEQCKKEGRYVPISTSGRCDEPMYRLRLRIRDPRNGNEYQTTEINVAPDCGYAGEIIVMSIPLP